MLKIQPWQTTIPRMSNGVDKEWRFACGMAVWAGCAVLALPARGDGPFAEARRVEDAYTVQRWGVEDGLPEGAVTALARFPDGFIWLTTPRHVVRFDGVEFVTYPQDAFPESPPPRFKSLLRDQRGRLWVAGEDGVMRCEDGRWRRVLLEGAVDASRGEPWRVETPDGTIDQSPHLVLFWVKEHPDGTVWVASNAGMYRESGQTLALVTPSDGAVAGSFYAADMDAGGRVWLSSAKGLISFDGAVYALANTPEAIGQGIWFQIFAGYGSALWCKHPDGRMFCGGGNTWQEVRPAGLRHAALLEMADGVVWYGAVEGVFRPNVSNWLVAAGSGIEKAHDVRCLMATPDGSVWAGTGNGLFQIRRRSVRMYPAGGQQEHKTVTALLPDGDGGFWAGLDGRGLLRGHPGSLKEVPTEPPVLTHATVTALFRADDGTFWAGTREDHLWRVATNGVIMQARTMEGNASRDITALAQTADGTMWAGSREGLLRYDGEDRLVKCGGPEAAVLCLFADRDGSLWIGTQTSGLWRRTPDGSFTAFRSADGLPSDTVRVLHCGKGDALWLGTPKGLAVVTRENGTPRLRACGHGLPEADIWQMVADKGGNLWLGSRSAIFRVHQNDLCEAKAGRGRILPVVSFGWSDGLEGKLTGGDHQGPLAVATADGRLWFATHAGVAMLDPDALNLEEPGGATVIEELSASTGSGERVRHRPPDAYSYRPGARDARHALRLPAGSRDVVIRFTVPVYAGVEHLRFRTRLEGLDNDWGMPSAERQALYAKLPPGDYRFRVMASSQAGTWREAQAGISFSIRAFFWQTTGFRLIVIVLSLAAAGALAGYLVRRRGQRRLQAAQRLVREREREMAREQAVARERIRIARDIHDDLGAGLTQMALLSELGQGEIGHPEKARVRMDQIFSTASGLAKSLNEIVWAVNPKNDTLDSVLTYLGGYADEYLRAAGLRFRNELPQEVPPQPVTSAVRHHLFCAVREALNNVIKHAGASEVWLAAEFDGGRLSVEVRDNGRGFDPSTVNRRAGRHNGLVNMRRRMEEVHGGFTIETAPGRGTCLSFSVSLDLAT